jgi:MoaA/NifB/PqqE/SkfB family radical SAM enzyme
MLKLSEIRCVHVELTTRCNARCPMCMRNYRGVDHNSGYPDTELTLENFQHILTPDILKTIDRVNFNGNLGDFSLAKDGAEIVQYLVAHDITVDINTNGSLRSTTWWQSLVSPNVTIGFALDGLVDTHARYRQDTDWNRIIENAQAYIAAGGRAIWRFVPFDHNRHQEAECRRLADEMGFIEFENIYDGRDAGPVYTRAGEFSHWLGPTGNVPPIKDMLQSHITWYDSKTVKIKKDTPELDIRCYHKIAQEIYLAADGTVYPCCYLGFYPLSMNHPGNKELAPMVAENNALEYPLEHCLDWFESIEQAWSKSSIAEGRPYQCVSTCNQNLPALL